MDYGFTLVSCYNSNYYVVLRGDLSGGIHKKKLLSETYQRSVVSIKGRKKTGDEFIEGNRKRASEDPGLVLICC